MNIKFTAKTNFLILILIGISFYSCFEEPFIEPVKRPYSSVRVGNFSYNQPGFTGNIDQFNVYIDGELKGTVGINQFTGYFDLPSGERQFVLLAGTDTIYKGGINIVSYEEMSIVFDGVYAPGVDTLMSFSPYSIGDGYVYAPEAPAGGYSRVITTNVAPNTSTENQIIYSLAFVSSTIDSTRRNLFKYNETYGLDLPPGDYTVWVMEDITDNPLAIKPEYDTLAHFNQTFSAGLLENLFITGNPGSPVVIKETQTPLPVRAK
jgi:hypothetical protein